MIVITPSAPPQICVFLSSLFFPLEEFYRYKATLKLEVHKFDIYGIHFLFQEGKIRAKLAKILKGKDGVRFENSFATGDGIKIVSHISHFY